MAKILIIDDEAGIRDMVALGLKEHEVIKTESGVDGLLAAVRHKPDIILLDVKMRGVDGFEVCRRIRADPELANMPIIFSTGRSELSDKLEGFEVGADDYVIKPFNLGELKMRIRAVLRRAKPDKKKEANREVHMGEGVTLNLLSREVAGPKGLIILTPTEFTLLEYMLDHRDSLLPTSQLLEKVWDYPLGVGDPALVRMHIRNLREKIEPDPSNPKIIRTVGRQGYTIRS